MVGWCRRTFLYMLATLPPENKAILSIISNYNSAFASKWSFPRRLFFDIRSSTPKIFRAITGILMQYRISCMAIGGIGAYLLVFDKQRILSVLFRKDMQWIVYIVTIGLLLLKVGAFSQAMEGFPSIFHEMYSFLFIIIILNLAANPNSILTLDYSWMTYLGKVSYELYMYHPIIRILSLELTEHLFKREISGWQMNLMLYSSTLLSTILISTLSYEFFEKKFLRLKNKFTS